MDGKEQRTPLLSKSDKAKNGHNSIQDEPNPRKDIVPGTETRRSFREYFRSCLGGTDAGNEVDGDDEPKIVTEKTTRVLKNSAKLHKHMKIMNNFAVLFATIGFCFMIVDMENLITYRYDTHPIESIIFKGIVTGSTLILICFVLEYHRTEIRLKMLSHDTHHRKSVLTWKVKGQIILEVIICALHVPIGYGYYMDIHSYSWVVYLDFALNVAMFLRIYLVGRMMRLNSSLQLEKTTTGFIAASFSGQCAEVYVFVHSCPKPELSKNFSSRVYLSTSCGK